MEECPSLTLVSRQSGIESERVKEVNKIVLFNGSVDQVHAEKEDLLIFLTKD